MTPEEYERYKEAEKEHLRKLRKLKQAVRDLERQKTVTRAVEGITEEPRRLLDEQQELVERVSMEAARSEARLEIALEAAEAKAPAEREPTVSPAEADEVVRRARARELVRQMREGEGPEPAPPASREEPQAARRAAKADAEESDPPPLPEKTIGRMKP